MKFIKKTADKFEIIKVGLKAIQPSSLKAKMFLLSKNTAYTTETFFRHKHVSLLEQITKKGMPAFVIFIELENIRSALDSLSTQRDSHHRAVLLSAFADFGANCLELAGLDDMKLTVKRKAIFKSNSATHGRILGYSARDIKLPVGKFFIKSAAILTSALCIYDTYQAYMNNDRDAAFFSFLQAGVTTSLIFMTGPLAVALFGASVALSIAYTVTKDTPLEKWIKNGPFGTSPLSGKYKNNSDPDTALFCLLDIMFKAKESVIPIDKLNGLDKKEKEEISRNGYTHCVAINYEVPFLLASHETKYTVYLRVGKKITMPKYGESFHFKNKNANIKIEAASNGVIAFFKSDQKQKYEYGSCITPCVAIRSRLSTKNTIFPMVYNKKNLTYTKLQ